MCMFLYNKHDRICLIYEFDECELDFAYIGLLIAGAITKK